MDAELDALFKIAEKKYRDPSVLRCADDFIEQSEQTYILGNPVEQSRVSEKIEIEANIKMLEKKLKRLRSNVNSRSARRRDGLSKRIAAERDNIRNEIARCKVRLDEIDMENSNDSEKSEVPDDPESSSFAMDMLSSNPYTI